MAKAKKICFIVNPISGVGKQKIIEKLIHEIFSNTSFNYDIVYTQAPKHATELSTKAVDMGFDIVAAVGGDGTMNEVGKSLIGKQIALAIVPLGSGNGLARHLDIPTNPQKALKLIEYTHIKTIDTFTINGLEALNIGGVGFDAWLADKFSHSKKRGFRSYLRTFLKEFFVYKPQSYSIEIDGKVIERKAFLICFANGTQYGNNAFIAPSASTEDGLIDLNIFKPFPPVAFPRLVYSIFNKTLNKSTFMEVIKVKSFTVYQSSELAHIDGEPITLGKRLHVKVNPLSLRVVVPELLS